MTTIEATTMPRKTKTDKKVDEKSTEKVIRRDAAKLDHDVHQDAKIVAVHEGKKVADLLSEILRPILRERKQRIFRTERGE